jgi:hypothetical protein
MLRLTALLGNPLRLIGFAVGFGGRLIADRGKTLLKHCYWRYRGFRNETLPLICPR